MEKNILVIAVVVILVLAVATLVLMQGPAPEAGPVACPADAKICPDGSAVGRVGPDCEFAPCPEPGPIEPPSPGKLEEHICTPEEKAAEICTMDYTPVCGYMEDGSMATYGNACGACATEGVVKYIPGECPSADAEETCGDMTLSTAIAIAEGSDCVANGTLTGDYMCNDYTGTWWLDLDIDKEGCNPACVINVETEEAEINWRCTGLLT